MSTGLLEKLLGSPVAKKMEAEVAAEQRQTLAALQAELREHEARTAVALKSLAEKLTTADRDVQSAERALSAAKQRRKDAYLTLQQFKQSTDLVRADCKQRVLARLAPEFVEFGERIRAEIERLSSPLVRDERRAVETLTDATLNFDVIRGLAVTDN